MVKYYEYIDKYTIKPAPRPIRADGKDIFTTDESIYNQYGYYRCEREDYPTDEKEYIPIYDEPENNVIWQRWEEVTPDEN